MVDFTLSPEIRDLRRRVSAFMGEHIYPNEVRLFAEDDEAEALTKELQQKVKQQGMWAMFIGPEAGGSGQGFLPYAYVNEILGRSAAAPRIFGCQAPDTGNAEILHMFGTEEHKERWMKPLVAGTIRSFFSMTEPEVSGADPTNLQTRAVRDGDEWVINGHKWFSSAADGSAFGIVMANSDPDGPPHRRFSQIIVPTETPGLTIVRNISVMGHVGRGYDTHSEIRYEDVRVPVTNTLGNPGDGFLIAQKRLGPGRIHHSMRWLGQAQRAFEIMCRYVLTREAFGGPLAEKQTIQNWIADSAAEIQASRLLTMHAAAKIDSGEDARVEISLIKFYGAQMLQNVIDRAVQSHGALGVSDDTPLAGMYRTARAARIYDGPDEVHRMVVARRILRRFQEGAVYE
ncbi:MAG: acyl-CoA dehydrogenase family protein, partial [Dehalococcoidia bacterium]